MANISRAPYAGKYTGRGIAPILSYLPMFRTRASQSSGARTKFVETRVKLVEGALCWARDRKRNEPKTVNFYSQRLFRAVFPGRHVFDTLIQGEVEFQNLAISNLREGEVVVDAGPRVDTYLAELSAKRALKTYLIEASPRFANRLRSDVAHLNMAIVITTGLSDEP